MLLWWYDCGDPSSSPWWNRRPGQGWKKNCRSTARKNLAPAGTESSPSPPAFKPSRGLRKILRKATEEDLAREKKNRGREAESFSVAQAMIAERELPMRLIRAEYSFDASRVTFFFFSETRVDFRELVKDLAHKLKSRIEMRQIGVRDVARMIGGFGPCGRELCCSSFLKNFEPVSIRMAKKQEMVLNPSKISGVCGRLLCCLSYEFGMYDENKKDLAAMREVALKDKRAEEELRITEERKEADESRAAEDKRRQEDRKQQDQRRDKQSVGGQKGGGRTEKKKDQQQQEKKAQQPRPEQSRERQQPKPEKHAAAGTDAQRTSATEARKRSSRMEQEKKQRSRKGRVRKKEKAQVLAQKKEGAAAGREQTTGPGPGSA